MGRARASVNGYPVVGPATWRVSGLHPLFVWDFTQQSPGALVLPTGITFARASSGHTVQTGTSTLTTTGITSNDVARGGRILDAHNVGMLIEPPRTNSFPNNRVPTSWAAGSWSSTASGNADAAGGTSAYRCQTASGGTGRYYATGSVSGTYTATVWAAKGPGSGAFQLYAGLAPNAAAVGATLGASWARYSLTTTMSAAQFYNLPGYAGDGSAVGGVVAAAKDCLLDFAQTEAGSCPSSIIITAGGSATRAAERASVDSTRAVQCVSSGRIAIYLRFRALAANTELDASQAWLLYWPTGNGGWYYDVASKYFYGYNSTTASRTANNALTWSRYDLLEFVIECGNGTSVLKWRVNSGAVNTASFSVTNDSWSSVSLASGFDFCTAAGTGHMHSIVEVLMPCVPGRAPF